MCTIDVRINKELLFQLSYEMTNSNILISYSLKENFAIMYGIMHKVSRMEYS